MNDLMTLLQDLAVAASDAAAAADDAMQLQKRYEHWLCRDSWKLFSEALPLALGQDPNEWQFQLKQVRLAELMPQAQSALIQAVMETNRPEVLNRAAAPEAWDVRPTDFYQWCSASRLALPEPFERIAQFILKTVKSVPGVVLSSPSVGVLPGQSDDRERVLGAALNLVAKCPERCRDSYGFVSGENIVRLILQQSVRWFDQEQPPFSAAEMTVLIDKWLE